MEIVVLVFIGFIIGFLVDTLTPGRIVFGWLIAIVLGIVGAAIGGFVFADQDVANLLVGSLAVVPAIIGAFVLVLVFELITFAFGRRPRS